MEFGGAEKVIDSFLKIYPKADVYTLFIVPAARQKIEKKYPAIRIYTSVFQGLIHKNKVSKYISVIKIFSWIYWEFLNLQDYDLVISSSHSFMSKNVKKRKGAFHLSYIHTPPRYLYEEFNEINWIRSGVWKYLFWPIKEILRAIDKNGSKRADIVVANSRNVQQRIKRYYRRKAEIVYPPVEVKSIGEAGERKDYYVCLSRLVKQKGIDLAVKTCSKNKISLVVVGDGDESQKLQKAAGETIKFVGNCEEKRKLEIMSQAKALLFASKDEDFGIVPVEALKTGIPVVAYNSGGVKETVDDGKNGVLFSNYTEDGLFEAMKRLDRLKISEGECRKSANKFSEAIFTKQIKNLIPE